MSCIKCMGYVLLGFLHGTRGKEPACQYRRHKRCGFHPWVGKIPWRRVWQPTPIFLPGESHGQKTLVGNKSTGLQRVEHNWSNLAHTQCSSFFHFLIETIKLLNYFINGWWNSPSETILVRIFDFGKFFLKSFFKLHIQTI